MMHHNQRLDLAAKSLTGLSIGDAFGDSFFGEQDVVLRQIQDRIVPETQWEFTDDTVMAIAVFQQLERNQGINQDELAKAFVINHDLDPMRGYGATARRVLREIGEGGDWRQVSGAVFDGMGSRGNGAAMRNSPIGAYFWDDLETVKAQAVLSAEITHMNVDGIAGAIAVAIAAALATQIQFEKRKQNPADFILSVASTLPDCNTKSRLRIAAELPISSHNETLRKILGNGSEVQAHDTVPFAIWCAAHHLANFEEALWKAVSVLGDRDTICAIVGGIVAMSSDAATIPSSWSKQVESWENSAFR